MKNPLLSLFAACCGFLPLAAQEHPHDPAPTAQAPVEDRALVSLKFPGGTLKQLLDVVRAQAPAVNIVASELAAEVPLPPIELRDVGCMAALDAIARIVPEPYRAKINVSKQSPGGAAMCAVMVQSPRPPAQTTTVQVFSLASLIRELPGADAGTPTALPAQTVLSALEAGARVMGEPLDMRFHEESSLLFVKGGPTQLELVQQVLGNLQREQDRLRAELERRRNAQRATKGTESGR